MLTTTTAHTISGPKADHHHIHIHAHTNHQCGDEVVDVADDGPLSAKTLFGHVRAASEGSVSPTNSHPFVFGSLLWMHNGAMPNFGAFKDTLKSRLRPSVRGLVVGQVTETNAGRSKAHPWCQQNIHERASTPVGACAMLPTYRLTK